MNKYYIREGYEENLNNNYYDDSPEKGVIWQPDVYEYAVQYAKLHKIINIIDIGSGNGEKLLKYKDDFKITFIDFGSNLEVIKKKFNSSLQKHTYINQNFEEAFPKLSAELLIDSIVICSDVIEHIRNLDNLLKGLVELSKKTNLLMISTPERQKLYGYDHSGIPNNKCHVREWKIEELEKLFKHWGMLFSIGLTRTNNLTRQRATIIILSGKDLELKTLYNPSDKAQEPALNIDKIAKQMPHVVDTLKTTISETIAIINPLDNNLVIGHLKNAIEEGYSLKINIFKLIDTKSLKEFYSAAPESISRLTVGYVTNKIIKGDRKEIYPVSFCLLCHPSLRANKIPLLQISNFKQDYLLELLLGFPKKIYRTETLSVINDPGDAQLLIENIKNSAKIIEEKEVKIKELESLLLRVKQPLTKKLVRSLKDNINMR